MAANETNVATSHSVLNYSGLLFNKGNTATPFSTLIGGKSRDTHSWAFPTSIDYTTSGGTAQPSITESASLTAPTREMVSRQQEVNYVQIYQRAIKLSYGKLSSMDQLSGLNIVGAEANPANEYDFQVAAALAAMRNDIEFTFLNGVGQNGTYDDVAYKTNGILSAISTNVEAASSAGLGYWLIAQVMKDIAEANAPTDGLVLMARPVNIMQLNADASSNGMTIVPASREINGLKLDTLLTPFGTVSIVANQRIAAGSALIFNPAVCAPVHMPVPNKGNFFVEELAKQGAADDYQLYGQCGLDYGAEWYHGKITGLATTFTAPTYSKVVKTVSDT